MSSPNTRKNIIIKNKYMNRKFGLLKACILRCLQRKQFLDTVNAYDNILNRCSPSINVLKSYALRVTTNEYFDFYYYNTDLWVDGDGVDINKKSFSIKTDNILYKTNGNIIEPEKYFYKHLCRLGFLCRGIVPNNKNICNIRCEEYLCNNHIQFRHDCMYEINKLNCKLPAVLINLIIQYTFAFY